MKKLLDIHKQKIITTKMKLLVKELPSLLISLILFDNFINDVGEE